MWLGYCNLLFFDMSCIFKKLQASFDGGRILSAGASPPVAGKHCQRSGGTKSRDPQARGTREIVVQHPSREGLDGKIAWAQRIHSTVVTAPRYLGVSGAARWHRCAARRRASANRRRGSALKAETSEQTRKSTHLRRSRAREEKRETCDRHVCV